MFHVKHGADNPPRSFKGGDNMLYRSNKHYKVTDRTNIVAKTAMDVLKIAFFYQCAKDILKPDFALEINKGYSWIDIYNAVTYIKNFDTYQCRKACQLLGKTRKEIIEVGEKWLLQYLN